MRDGLVVFQWAVLFWYERVLRDVSHLLRFPNVIVTPHNAYNTEAAPQQIISTTLDNNEAFANGAPQNVVSAN